MRASRQRDSIPWPNLSSSPRCWTFVLSGSPIAIRTAHLRAERGGAAGAVAETRSGGGPWPPARAARRRRVALNYYAANRPGEAANLREEDFTLPEEGWGEVVLSTGTPRVGSGWTDTGESFDTRGLKKRARKAPGLCRFPRPCAPGPRAHQGVRHHRRRLAVPVRLKAVACCPKSTVRFGRRPGSQCWPKGKWPRRWLSAPLTLPTSSNHASYRSNDGAALPTRQGGVRACTPRMSDPRGTVTCEVMIW